MPEARLKVIAVTANAAPTAISQPVRGVGAAQPRDGEQRDARRPARSRATSPPGRRGLVEQAQRPGVTAEHAAAATAARTPAATRPAGLAEQAPEAVVAEDQRPDRVVVGARDPRPVGRRA